MDLRPGYVRTDLGTFPEDWPVKRLREISPSQSVGLVINPSTYYDPRGTIPLLVGSNVGENRIDSDSARCITPQSNTQLPASQLRAGDLVTVRVGEPGVTAVVPPHLDGCNCASMMIVRRGAFCSLWLCHMMNSRIGRSQVEGVQYGTAQKQFNISDAVNFRFPVPPRPEQEAIAGALADADAWIESLEKLIAKKRQIKHGVIQQLLTGKRRLPGFSSEWTTELFGAIANPRTSRVDPRVSGSFEFCVELEHIEPVTGRLLGHTEVGPTSSLKTVFEQGDVLFGKLRAYLRKFWLASRQGVCSTEIWALAPRPEKVISEYLYQLVTVDAFIDAASTSYGTHMPRSDWSVVARYAVRLPGRDEQTAIASVLTDMDNEVAALEAKLAKARQLKQGMMQPLLTGKVKLA